MSHTVLYAITIYSVGCIIPTPLDRQPTETKYAPSIDTQQTQPALGPLTRTADDSWRWHIVASDPNLDDKLSAILVERSGSGANPFFATTVELTKQTIIDKRQPAHWSGDSSQFQWCRLLLAGVHYIYVYVSDQPFVSGSSGDMLDPATTDGLTDSNHWEVTCS